MIKRLTIIVACAIQAFAQNVCGQQWTIQQVELGKTRCYAQAVGEIDQNKITIGVEFIGNAKYIIFHIIIPNANEFKYFNLNDFNVDFSGKTALNRKAISINACKMGKVFDADGVYFEDEADNNNNAFEFNFLVQKNSKTAFGELLNKTVLGCNEWEIKIKHKQKLLKVRISLFGARDCLKKFAM